jgi:hypothetical protein
MSDKIERAKRLSSAKTTEVSKNVKVEGFEKLLKELQAITVANHKSQEAITKSLNQLSQVIVMSGQEGIDMKVLVDAIDSLKGSMGAKANPPMDYVVNFDRDKYGLMKSGIQLNSKPKRLN